MQTSGTRGGRCRERRRARAWALVLLLALAVSGTGGGVVACASIDPGPLWNQLDRTEVWPLPPSPPRIRYVGSIRRASDIGAGRGLGQWLLSSILGAPPAEMVKPIAVATNASGLLVVTDPGVPAIHFFDLERREYRRVEASASVSIELPVGVAAADTGRVYVTDSSQGRVFVFDESGVLVDEFGAGMFRRPTGIALGPAQQRLYVADTLACRVVVLDLEGRELTRFGHCGTAPGEFNFPTFISVARDGVIGVSDSLNFRVQLFDPDGTPLAMFGHAGNGGGDFSRPKGVASDSLGRLYVVDAAFQNVQIFDRSGALYLAVGGPGRDAGGFSLPTGLFIDATDTIWVADSMNGRVQVFRLLRDPS